MNKFYQKFLFLIISVGVIFGLGIFTTYAFVAKNLHPDMRQEFMQMDPEQMHSTISDFRSLAIEEAKERGDYKCCISPPCTMCYDKANKWNYQQAGKCFCDDFIAKGEEPCPQCKAGSCSYSE